MSGDVDPFKIMEDPDRFPALAYNLPMMRELAHALSAELDNHIGPITIGSGHRLDGRVLLGAMTANHMMLRRMTPDEKAACETAYDEAYGDE